MFVPAIVPGHGDRDRECECECECECVFGMDKKTPMHKYMCMGY